MNKISTLIAGALLAAAGAGPAFAANTVVTWTGGGGDGQYNTAANWSSGSKPDLTTATTAQITGAAVTYNATSDLFISNGGTLEISAGATWTQTGGNNYIQLAGGGTILVDGGTFNQGTDSANAFSTAGTNAFTITAGTANFNRQLNLTSGVTYTQTGGATVVDPGDGTHSALAVTTVGATFVLSGGSFSLTGEFHPGAGASITVSGGTLNVGTLISFDGGASSITLSAGTIVLGSSAYAYGFYNLSGTSSDYVNFTTGSTGSIEFASGVTLANIQSLITSNKGFYKNGVQDTTLSDFSIVSNGTNYFLSLVAVPEPSTWAMVGFGFFALLLRVRRPRASRI